jgi:ABC-type bacteriocin/lantibiotic exporter with double-glycine peptidase domain
MSNISPDTTFIIGLVLIILSLVICGCHCLVCLIYPYKHIISRALRKTYSRVSTHQPSQVQTVESSQSEEEEEEEEGVGATTEGKSEHIIQIEQAKTIIQQERDILKNNNRT